MESLIIIIFILAMISFSVQLGFTNNWRVSGAWYLISALFIFLMHTYAIEQSYALFKDRLMDIQLMTDFVVLIVIEAIAGVLLAIFMIRNHYGEKVKKGFKFLIYIPGIMVFPALFYFESFIFLQIHNIAFKTLALAIALLLPFILLVLKYGLKYLIPEFDLRIELKFLLHIFQLIAAIILSVQLFKLPVNSGYEIENGILYKGPLLILVLILTGFISGYIWNQVKIKRLLNKSLKDGRNN